MKINEGTFENFEGEVDSIDETNGRVTVMINIFGRSHARRTGILANMKRDVSIAVTMAKQLAQAK